MNIASSKSAVGNKSFTANIQNEDNICNCLGCYELADIEISLKIGQKSITILVCKDCQHKFKES